MATHGNHKAAAALCNALGIKHCRKLVLYLEVDQPALVQAEFYPDKDGLLAIEPIIKRFRLEED